jgi:hypothetical protein
MFFSNQRTFFRCYLLTPFLKENLAANSSHLLKPRTLGRHEFQVLQAHSFWKALLAAAET